MNKKIIFLISGILLSVSAFATTWKYEGGLDGNSGMTIIYKTLPPLIVEVDEPEMMVVPRGNQPFTYSEVSRGKQPLNVSIKVFFNKNIIQENEINKNIVRTIYDSARFTFANNGNFRLIKNDSLIHPKNKKGEIEIGINDIDGEVFFTDRRGVVEATAKGKMIQRKIGDTIQNGTLSSDDVYIDAIFNKERKELTSGYYSGKATLEIEFLGKELTNN